MRARPRSHRRFPLGRLIVAGGLALFLAAGCGGGRRAPVVVIGLDGAEFDLLVPWMEAGELPHLKGLLDSSAIGKLRSVYPVLSPVAWTSAVTGVNPGKHGIFDFQKHDPQGGDLLIETATHRRAVPIWLLLSEAGQRCGVLNVPMTYPPDPVRGQMVSGFPFPQGDVNVTYPPELEAKLGEYPLDILGLNLFDRRPEELLADFEKSQTSRRRVALDWLRAGDLDFAWIVFTDTDKVQHFFWQYMDPNHPRYTAEGAAKYRNAILDVWRRQDGILGEMLALLPEDATVVLLSDHGFDGLYRQVNMSNWLAGTDLQAWLDTHAIPPMLVTNGLLHYSLNGSMVGASDREAFVDKFIALGKTLRDPESGTAPIEGIFRREDIYSGRMIEKAPDIVIQEAPKYYLARGSPEEGAPIVQNVEGASFSAHHRPDGIFAVRGPYFTSRTQGSVRERLARGGDFDGARIVDVSPTLLALMNQTIPDAMDGRVLTEVFVPAFLAEHPPQVAPVEGFLLDREVEEVLTDEERRNLKAIPYIN